jgi:hypothetical protein
MGTTNHSSHHATKSRFACFLFVIPASPPSSMLVSGFAVTTTGTISSPSPSSTFQVSPDAFDRTRIVHATHALSNLRGIDDNDFLDPALRRRRSHRHYRRHHPRRQSSCLCADLSRISSGALQSEDSDDDSDDDDDDLIPSNPARTTSEFLASLWQLIARGNQMVRGVSGLSWDAFDSYD